MGAYDHAMAPAPLHYDVSAVAPAPVAESPADEKPEPVMIVTMQKKASAKTAQELFMSGLKLYHQGVFEAAAKDFAGAAEMAPTKASYVYFQALATYQSGNLEGAAELVKTAVRVEMETPQESFGRMMERVQGQHRVWLEDARRQYRAATLEVNTEK
jgi:hypothetical protein